jgi:transposase-like protein
VVLLEKIYLKLRPFMVTHPNLNIYVNNNNPQCPKCSSNHVKKEGFSYTDVSKFQRYSCLDCKGWFRGRENLNKRGK